MQLPSRDEMRRTGGLAAEIAGEGEPVLFTGTLGGLQVKMPAAKPIFPDLSEIKCIRPLFFRVGFEPFPVVLYHPTEGARTFTAEEAEEVGFRYVKPTPYEVTKYKLSGDRGIEQRDEGCLWREEPYGPQKFDPSRPESGKCYTPPQTDPATLLARVIQQNNGQQSASQTVVLERLAGLIAQALGDRGERSEAEGASNPLLPGRDLLEAEAASLGLKVDGRWSTEKLAQKIDEHRKSVA